MDLSVAMSDCFLKVEKDDKTTGIQQQLTSFKSPNRSQQICYFCPTFSRFCCTGLPDSLGPRKSQGLASEKPERHRSSRSGFAGISSWANEIRPSLKLSLGFFSWFLNRAGIQRFWEKVAFFLFVRWVMFKKKNLTSLKKGNASRFIEGCPISNLETYGFQRTYRCWGRDLLLNKQSSR